MWKMGISFKPENLLVLRGKFSFITLGLVGGLINVNFLRIFTIYRGMLTHLPHPATTGTSRPPQTANSCTMYITPCGRPMVLEQPTPLSRRCSLDIQSSASRRYIHPGMWPRQRPYQ